MSYTKRKAKWNWRNFLTKEEAAILGAAERAKARWLELNKQRAGIANRAIHRAKHAARTINQPEKPNARTELHETGRPRSD
jgi:hypothetical protein